MFLLGNFWDRQEGVRPRMWEGTFLSCQPRGRPFFSVCIREVSSKKPKGLFGVYRYFAGADSEYWHGALKKIVPGWRLACVLFPPFPNPEPWFAADGRVLGIRVYAGVGSRPL